jgi:hypothetical protein
LTAQGCRVLFVASDDDDDDVYYPKGRILKKKLEAGA